MSSPSRTALEARDPTFRDKIIRTVHSDWFLWLAIHAILALLCIVNFVAISYVWEEGQSRSRFEDLIDLGVPSFTVSSFCLICCIICHYFDKGWGIYSAILSWRLSRGVQIANSIALIAGSLWYCSKWKLGQPGFSPVVWWLTLSYSIIGLSQLIVNFNSLITPYRDLKRPQNSCRLQTSEHGQIICQGCIFAGRTFDRDPERTVKLHRDFKELSICSESGCQSCRIFRKSLILSALSQEPDGLDSLKKSGPVSITLQPDTLDGKKLAWSNGSLTIHARTADLIYKETLKLSNSPIRPGNLAFHSTTDKVLSKARQWLQTCEDKHGQCQHQVISMQDWNPRRLIYVGTSNVAMKLMDMSGLDQVEYATLSYCWGEDSVTNCRTLRSNLNDYLRQLPKLPKTLEDAVTITRELGLKYLWVDCLCIIQGDQQDWARESSQMHRIYGNSKVTIVGFSSLSNDHGLLLPRDLWKYPLEPCRLSKAWLTDGSWKNLDSLRAGSKWASRGWTFQEELLSRRALYFTEAGIFWSCQQEANSETQGQSHFEKQEEHEPPMFLERMKHRTYKTATQERWTTIVKEYVRRSLTRPTDRFAAISGIVSLLQESISRKMDSGVYVEGRWHNTGDVYIEGLWQNTFTYDLLWRVKRACSEQSRLLDVAPTWSWASLPFGMDISWYDYADIRSGIQASTSKLDLISFESGLSTSSSPSLGSRASFTAEGQLKRLTRSQQLKWVRWETKLGSKRQPIVQIPLSDGYCALNPRNGNLAVSRDRQEALICRMDFMISKDLDWERIYCFQVINTAMLVLRKVNEDENVYERIGCAKDPNALFFEDSERVRIKCV